VDDIDVIEEEVHEILEYVGLDIAPDTIANNMAYGEKRQLEVAIAIASDPDLLLLDEPTAGIDTEKASGLIDMIRKLNESYPILLVEHNIDLVLDISDRIVVLSSGAVIAEGPPDEIIADEAVQSTYLGETTA
jgi:branched-chain amino acid transport system ATP-binding protein